MESLTILSLVYGLVKVYGLVHVALHRSADLRKLTMYVITQPFTFWRMFKKAGILKYGIDYVILNPLSRNDQT